MWSPADHSGTLYKRGAPLRCCRASHQDCLIAIRESTTALFCACLGCYCSKCAFHCSWGMPTRLAEEVLRAEGESLCCALMFDDAVPMLYLTQRTCRAQPCSTSMTQNPSAHEVSSRSNWPQWNLVSVYKECWIVGINTSFQLQSTLLLNVQRLSTCCQLAAHTANSDGSRYKCPRDTASAAA